MPQAMSLAVSHKEESGVWCHQCKTKRPLFVSCTNNQEGCTTKYCDNCCGRHYGLSVKDLKTIQEWKCFKCTGHCSCAHCKRKRGENVPVRKRRRKIQGQNPKQNLPTAQSFSFQEAVEYSSQPFLHEQSREHSQSGILPPINEVLSAYHHPSPVLPQRSAEAWTPERNSPEKEQNCSDCEELIHSLRSKARRLEEEIHFLRQFIMNQDNQNSSISAVVPPPRVFTGSIKKNPLERLSTHAIYTPLVHINTSY